MLSKEMFSQASVITEQLVRQACSGLGLVHLLLLQVAVAAFLLLRRRAGGASPTSPAKGDADADADTAPVLVGGADRQDPFIESLPKGVNVRLEKMWDPPDFAHIRAVLHRGEHRDLVHSNSTEPWFWENEYCTGLYLPMFRPTANPGCDLPGRKNPGYEHFKGRKRLWEARLQIKFKVPIDGDGGLRFGLQMPEYVPVGRMQKASLRVVAAALRRVVGGDLHHTPGEPEGKKGEETELPMFIMPFWAFDQVIVTPEGDEPPELTRPDFGDLGVHRVADRQHFIELMSKLELKPGPTYSFSFWGVSQCMDAVKWAIVKGVPMSIDCNAFCKRPPITVCVYALKKGSTTRDDERHLESRKQYIFRCDFWSSGKPPARNFIRDLFPANLIEEEEEDRTSSGVQQRRSWLNLTACCSARGQ